MKLWAVALLLRIPETKQAVICAAWCRAETEGDAVSSAIKGGAAGKLGLRWDHAEGKATEIPEHLLKP